MEKPSAVISADQKKMARENNIDIRCVDSMMIIL